MTRRAGAAAGTIARPDSGRAAPWLERIGLAAIAAVLAIMFGGVAAASWIGGEPFLAVMGGDRLPDDRLGRGAHGPPRLTPDAFAGGGQTLTCR